MINRKKILLPPPIFRQWYVYSKVLIDWPFITPASKLHYATVVLYLRWGWTVTLFRNIKLKAERDQIHRIAKKTKKSPVIEMYRDNLQHLSCTDLFSLILV